MKKWRLGAISLAMALALAGCQFQYDAPAPANQETGSQAAEAAAEAAGETKADEGKTEEKAEEAKTADNAGKAEAAKKAEADKAEAAEAVENAEAAENAEGAEEAAADENAGDDVTVQAAEAAEEEETQAKAREGASQAEETAEDGYGIYKEMDGIIFGFMSGVGAWETTLEVADDGSFKSFFYDANMGETGEGYDNGTLYECEFTGRFSAARKADDTSYTAKVEELHYETEKDGSSTYIDDEHTLHVMTEPYGLTEDAEIVIYTPGQKVGDLSEEFMSWMLWKIDDKAETLGEIAIYNGTDGYVFFPDHWAMGDADEFYGWEDETETETGTETESVTETADGTGTGTVGNTETEEGSRIYRQALHAYENQAMPDYNMLPYVPYSDEVISRPYPSVTLSNLQGRWVNHYKDGVYDVVEVLTVNGSRGRIETWIDGEKRGVWNGEGTVELEDRSDRNVCPAFRINEEDGGNLCTIYIRWVKDNTFFDGGFQQEWKRMNEEDIRDTYLYDTVTLENLQGVWYSEYTDSAGFYQDMLTIDGDQATLFETVNGEPSSVWNGSGTASITLERVMGDTYYPELLIDKNNSPASRSTGVAGIYITSVLDNAFYDPAFSRWWVRISKDYYEGLDFAGPEITHLGNGGAVIEGDYKYTVLPNGPMKDDHYSRWEIRVENGAGMDQIINLEIDPDSQYFPDADTIVSETDVNFDGITDVLLYKGSLGIHYTQFWECWLSDGNKLTKCRGFEKIPEPYTDAGDKMLHGMILDGANSYLRFKYRIEGNKIIQIEETRYTYDANQEDFVAE